MLWNCETVKLCRFRIIIGFLFFFPFLRSRIAVSHIMLNDSYVTYVSCAYLSYITHKNIYGLLQNLPKCFVKFKKKTFENTFRGKHIFKTFLQFVHEVPPSAGQENLNKAQRCRISLTGEIWFKLYVCKHGSDRHQECVKCQKNFVGPSNSF